MVWFYTLASVVFVSLLSLVGIFFLLADRTRLQKLLPFLVSFAIGALAGDAFIHLIPEAFEKLGAGLSTSLLIILGMVVFFSVERFIRWRHCHIPTSEHHVHPVATLNVAGDAVHNFIDGIIIGASYLVSFPIGLTTTVAVVLHEIPQEIGDFGILIHAGLGVKKALLFNFGSALIAILGAVLALAVGPHLADFSLAMLPVTAGGFIYIAGSDLIPEVQETCGGAGVTFAHILTMVFGIGLMSALVLID
ncbi:MAG: ZIP family metal transporter [Dehalococcoidia bacterium]|jgi:zinc and cadmium transporter|nr:MAG: ZIP family metal transporter [Dehalococcoidia bacterium]